MNKFQNIRERIVELYGGLIHNKNKFKETINKPLQQTFRVNRIKDKKSGVGMNNGEKKYRVFPVYDKDNKEWWSVNYIKNMVADEYFDEEMNRDE